MKTIARNFAIYTLALYLLPQLIPGVHISGGLLTLLIGGIGLTLMFLILKPILNIISFPINLVTLGIFSIFTNVFILYLLTVFVSGITIEAFSYPGTQIFGVAISPIYFNTLFAYIYTAFVLSFIDSFFSWLVK